MQGLYSGFDAARASWEFPEGTSAGFLGYPSDPVSDGLESTTGDGTQATLDNDHDTAVKVRDDYNDDLTWPDLTSRRFVSPLLVWAESGPTGTPYCGKTDCTSALPPASWPTVASVPLSRYSSTRRRSLESAMLWLVLTSKSRVWPNILTNITSTITRLHHDNKNVIRNFLFLGFQPLAPGHEFHPSNPNVVCFLYTIWTGT